MKVYFVRNYRRKIIVFLLMIILWAAMFLLADFFIHNSFIFNVTVNNYLSFSYPLAFEVDNIFINEEMDQNPVKTSYSFKKPGERKFSSYSSVKGKFGFEYPSVFTLQEQDFSGSEILYHIDFHNKPQTSNGFVQVWNMPYSIEEFLNKSLSQSRQNFTNFTSAPVTVSVLPGILWSYTVRNRDGLSIRGSEVFFKKDDLMYRISYFVPEKLWNNSQKEVFWNIVKSFRTN